MQFKYTIKNFQFEFGSGSNIVQKSPPSISDAVWKQIEAYVTVMRVLKKYAGEVKSFTF